MAEIVAKSKMYRQARAEEKEKQIDLTEKLDEDFDRIASLMRGHSSTTSEKSKEKKEKKRIAEEEDGEDEEGDWGEEEEEGKGDEE